MSLGTGPISCRQESDADSDPPGSGDASCTHTASCMCTAPLHGHLNVGASPIVLAKCRAPCVHVSVPPGQPRSRLRCVSIQSNRGLGAADLVVLDPSDDEPGSAKKQRTCR
eukprot:s721_g23.t1